MPPDLISSRKNPKIVALRKLSQRKHRYAQNRFAVEGLQLLGMALENGHQPLEVFYSQADFAGGIAPDLLAKMDNRGATCYPVSPKVMQSLSERDAPQGLVATFSPFEQTLADLTHLHHENSLIIVVDRLQDPGNLGTLIRTADAVGAGGLILLEPTVDPFDPKTIRGTMGSIFTLPLVRTADPASLFDQLKAQGFKITGADGYQGDIPWQSDVLTGPTALVMGNEARGLSDDVRPHLSHWVRLPLIGHAESLNVAIAGGVLMYHWLQANNKAIGR